MIDIMAQCPDDVSYKAQLTELAGKGYVFQQAFTPATVVGESGQTFWLRLCVIIPPASDSKILEEPLIEYRYSAELDGWTSDGVTTSALARGVHENLASEGLPQ